jgi:acyl-CoA thioester hydrolase
MLEVRIYYEDTDAGGVVYYANYLRYFERARIEYLRSRGVEIKDLISRGIHFVVVRVEADFQAPAELGDILEIETRFCNFTKVSFWTEYVIRRKGDNKIIVLGRAKLACINDNHKVSPIPEDVLSKIKDTQSDRAQ